jgi:uncharacterized membrane protein
VHIMASVGWFGAVVTFLVLAVVGITSRDDDVTRSAVLIMEPVGWFAIVPLNLASLATGLVCALTTPWGLLRHYWVVAKLLINVIATVVLLLYMQTLGYLADVASADPVDVDRLRDPSPLLHTSAATVLLILAMILAVYKPRGLTPYGWRRRARNGFEPGAA